MRSLSWLSALLLPLTLVACSDGGAASSVGRPDQGRSGERIVSGTFTEDAILDQVDAEDSGAMSADAIDSFLSQKSSCLVNHSFGGQTVGQLIADAAQQYHLNPLFLLAHLQKESSLVSKQGSQCPSKSMSKAFGCACPDGGSCSSQNAGFAKQLTCAASLTRQYLDDLDSGGSTVSGWSVGQPKQTLDQRSITPSNKITAALYTYTPWVGDQDAGGNAAPFGNYLFWKIWHSYANLAGYSGQSSDSGASDSGASDDGSVQNASDQGTPDQESDPGSGSSNPGAGSSDPGSGSSDPGAGSSDPSAEPESDPGSGQGSDPYGDPGSDPYGEPGSQGGQEGYDPGSDPYGDPGSDPYGQSGGGQGSGACCAARPGAAGCAEDAQIESCVCAQDSYCCTTAWDATCVDELMGLGCGSCWL